MRSWSKTKETVRTIIPPSVEFLTSLYILEYINLDILCEKDGKKIADDAAFSVTCLATYGHFAPFLAEESRVFTEGENNVKVIWTNYVKEGGVVLSQPERYITLK